MINFKAIAEMFKAIDKKAIGKACVEFFKRNEGTIIYGLGALGLGAMAKKCDIPLSEVTNIYANRGKIIDWDDIQFRSGPKDSAITAMTKVGCDTYYSDEKRKAIRGIRDLILSGDDRDSSTSGYAIRCLEKIANSTYYSDVKKAAQDAILEIGKRG